MILPASLEEFARTGRLGPFTCGMTRDAVRATAGSPDDWLNGQSAARSALWKYGNAELHFDRQSDRVWLIHFDWFDVPHCGASVPLDPWVIRRGIAAVELRAALHASGIGFTSRPDEAIANTGSIISAGGVSFLLGVEGGADLSLCVFGRGTTT